jgi:serine/threonine-protein kinase
MPDRVQPGHLLDGRYLLIDTIGHGGMSTVWRARDERLGRIAAVKILTGGRLAAADRLRTEAQSLARLHHPHIADVYDFGTGKTPYLVMEYIDAVTLSQALAGGKRLPWVEAASIAAQVASALAAAHRRGIVHRDVSGSNVLLTAEGVKLIDFGICASQGNPEADRGELVVGTPAYLAPERIDGQPVQQESDVYALGVALFRMLSGYMPFEAQDAERLIRAHREQPPPPLPPVPGMPVIVGDLCRACLAKDPAERPTATYVSGSLFDLLGPMVTVPVPVASDFEDFLSTHLPPWSENARALAAAPGRGLRGGRTKTAVAAGGVLLAVAAGWAVNGWDSPTIPPAAAGSLAEPSTSPPSQCAVTYQSLHDDGRSFTAAITVTNIGYRDIDDARLSFELPADQTLSAGPMWRQDGRTASTAPGLLVLPAGHGVRIPLAGTYSGVHAVPLAYALDDQPCSVSVLGPGGVSLISTPSSQPSHRPVIIVDASPPTAGDGQPPPEPVGSPVGSPGASPPSAPATSPPGEPSPSTPAVITSPTAHTPPKPPRPTR